VPPANKTAAKPKRAATAGPVAKTPRSAKRSESTVKKAAAQAGTAWKDPDEAFAAGLAMRRAMFGAGGADDQINGASDFMFPMQDYVTRWCFGETWTRPVLPPSTRSMLTLAMLVAYGRPQEIKVHVEGAVANGVTAAEIGEVMLHAMIYCGVPRAVEGFRVAEATLRELGVLS
jgi:4-carboxymuconolactone decarboxylase